MYNIVWFANRALPAEGGVERFVHYLADDLGKDYHLRLFAQYFDDKPYICSKEKLLKTKETGFSYKVSRIHSLFLEKIQLLPSLINRLPVVRSKYYEQTKKIAVNNFSKVLKSRYSKKSGKCAIIHSFAFGEVGLLAKKVAEDRQTPFVITPFVHAGRWGDAKHDINLYNSADAVIALSDWDAEELKRCGVYHDLIRVCGVGIPPFNGDGEGFRKKHAIGGLTVLYTGRLVNHKGWLDLCHAIARINNEGEKISLIIIGPEIEDIDKASIYKKMPFIKFMGKISETEKRDAFAASDLFCLPSTSEIFPVSILEAWQSRKPLLAYDIPAIKSIVKHGETGWLVKPDINSLEEGLRFFIKNSHLSLNLGYNGYQLLEEKYRIARIALWHRELYDELISKSRESTQINLQE